MSEQYASYPSLRDKSVLITGGASGIGAALVSQFSMQGARVGYLDRTSGEPDPAGLTTHFAACDLRDIEASIAAVRALESKIGPVEILVNNAGDDARHDVFSVTQDTWHNVMDVNLRHQFFLAQHVASQMVEKGGSIINLGSISWMKGARDVSVYATAKAAIAGMTKVLAREFGAHGIRVNCIAPGWVLTEKQVKRASRDMPGAIEAAVAAQALPEPIEAEDVARLALWLAADDSRRMTGQTIILDGGVV